jgi:hypothetical protein
MDLEIWIVLGVAAVVVVGIAVYLVMANRRTERLKEEFGPEYDRMLEEHEDRRVVESELEARRERLEELDIHPLDPASRQRYSSKWKDVQARFVDEPRTAVAQADSLVVMVMRDRGYPIDDFEQRAADISVDHPEIVENYRSAHDVFERSRTKGSTEATTEDLRRAFVHYRALFADLLEEPEGRELRQAT